MVVEGVRASADQPTFLLEELPVRLPERGLDVGVGPGLAAEARHRRDVAGGHDVNLQAPLHHRHGDAELRVFTCTQHNICQEADQEFVHGLPGPV